MKSSNPKAINRLLKTRGQNAYVDMALEYGKTFRHQGVVLTCDAGLVRQLLMRRENTAIRSKMHSGMAKLPGANGILFMDGEQWKMRAHALAPVFQRGHAETCAEAVNAIAESYASQWSRTGGGADLYDSIQQLGASAVLQMGFGLDPAYPPAMQLIRALVDYKQYTMVPDPRRRLDRLDFGSGIISRLPWILTEIAGMRRAMKNVDSALSALLARGFAETTRPGWLSQLMRIPLPPRELANEINHLYGAFNAIDFVITGALVEVARNAAWTERMRQELRTALTDSQVPGRDDLTRLPLTNAFMLEVLRCYPVSMGIARRTGEPVSIAGEQLATGTEVLILLHALQHHPEYWGDDSLQFNPDRWLVSPTAKVPFTYVPFLEGPRKCIGRHMAEMQLLVLLNAIVRRFEIRLLAEPVILPFMVPRFAGPIPFEVRPAGGH